MEKMLIKNTLDSDLYLLLLDMFQEALSFRFTYSGVGFFKALYIVRCFCIYVFTNINNNIRIYLKLEQR